jgi:ferredoxin
MSKIQLEREKCIGCGSCQALCPKYFEIQEDGKSHIKDAAKQPASPSQGGDVEEIEVEKLECAEPAAEACPVQCIHIIK